MSDANIPVRKLDLGVTPQRERSRTTEYFLKGPIPLRWLHAAASLPGKAYTLGNVLWWFRGMNPTKPIKVTRKSLAEFSISEDAYRDGLKRLEEAGLVKVTRPIGQRALVEILEPELKLA